MVMNLQFDETHYLRVSKTEPNWTQLCLIEHEKGKSEFEHQNVINVPTKQLDNLIYALQKAKSE